MSGENLFSEPILSNAAKRARSAQFQARTSRELDQSELRKLATFIRIAAVVGFIAGIVFTLVIFCIHDAIHH